MWKSEENSARKSASLWLFVAVLIVLNLLLYLPVLDNGFSLDDFNWLERARFAPSWSQFVFDVEPGQLLNPVPRALVLNFLHIFGTNPLPFHLAVLALHLVNVGLLLVLVDRLVGNRTIAVLAALLFSLQTSYDEAVFWVSAFPHVLSAGFCMATLLSARSYLESGRNISLILTGLGGIASWTTWAANVPRRYIGRTDRCRHDSELQLRRRELVSDRAGLLPTRNTHGYEPRGVPRLVGTALRCCCRVGR